MTHMTKEEFLKNYQFLSYDSVNPLENYGMLGYVSILVYGEILMVFKHVRKKEGTGDFFSPISFNVIRGTTKSYIDANAIDSKSKNLWLMDYIRECVTKAVNTPSVFSPIAPKESGGFPQEDLPF
jgi:hypothetical protein